MRCGCGLMMPYPQLTGLHNFCGFRVHIPNSRGYRNLVGFEPISRTQGAPQFVDCSVRGGQNSHREWSKKFALHVPSTVTLPPGLQMGKCLATPKKRGGTGSCIWTDRCRGAGKTRQ